MASKTKKWYFDSYPRRDGKKSWVQLEDVEAGLALSVYVKDDLCLTIGGELDQWGTWIGFERSKPFAVAQEWSTKSFIKAFMAALAEFAAICDLEGNEDKQAPLYEESSIEESSR